MMKQYNINESVHRAMAIQKINAEFGLLKNENALQGFIVEELTDLVEEAVISDSKTLIDVAVFWELWKHNISVERFRKSLYYEHLKHTGNCPSLVSIHLDPNTTSEDYQPPEMDTSFQQRKKEDQIQRLQDCKKESRTSNQHWKNCVNRYFRRRLFLNHS